MTLPTRDRVSTYKSPVLLPLPLKNANIFRTEQTVEIDVELPTRTNQGWSAWGERTVENSHKSLSFEWMCAVTKVITIPQNIQHKARDRSTSKQKSDIKGKNNPRPGEALRGKLKTRIAPPHTKHALKLPDQDEVRLQLLLGMWLIHKYFSLWKRRNVIVLYQTVSGAYGTQRRQQSAPHLGMKTSLASKYTTVTSSAETNNSWEGSLTASWSVIAVLIVRKVQPWTVSFKESRSVPLKIFCHHRTKPGHLWNMRRLLRVRPHWSKNVAWPSNVCTIALKNSSLPNQV